MRYALVDVGSGDVEETADADLDAIGRIASGDRQALAELYARHRLPLFHYVLQFTSDRGLAEEVLQDTFVAVWRGARTFERRSRVPAWLFGIARRQALKALRRARPEAVDLGAIEGLRAAEPDPERAVLESASYADLLAAIEELSPVHREVLLLSYVHELTYQEVANILRVPIGTVKSRLSNAKSALRALVASGEDGNRCG